MMDRIRQIVHYRVQNIRAFIDYFRNARQLSPQSDLVLLFHGIDTRGNQRYNLRFTSQSDFVFIANALKRYYVPARLRDLSSPSEFPRLVMTFDDGYKNWRTHLLPLLEKHRIPATLFITTSKENLLWTDQYDIFRYHYASPLNVAGHTFRKVNGFYRMADGVELNGFLKANGLEIIKAFQKSARIEKKLLDDTKMYWQLLDEEDIRYMSCCDWINFGSHGCTHTSLVKLSDAQLRSELNESKAYLSRITGSPIHNLSFPSGKYDERVIRFAREAGFELLLAENLLLPTDRSDSGRLMERKGIYTIGSKYRQYMNILSRI